MNPHKVIPRRDWVLLLEEQRIEQVGSIVLPGEELGIEKVQTYAATIIALGGGEIIPKLKLQIGDKVVYRGFLKYTAPITGHGELWESGAHKIYFLVTVQDLLAVAPPETEVGVLSGRPEVPHLVG